MDKSDIQNHISSTYFSLRFALAGLAFAFPIVLWALGPEQSTPVHLQGSMSAYYWVGGADSSRWLRDMFVGFLFAIGSLLYAYKGFSRLESVLLNVAAVAAFVVALFPMNWWGRLSPIPVMGPEGLQILFFEPTRGYIHNCAAILLFFCIAFVSIRCSKDTLSLLPATANRYWFENAYKLTGHLMWALPVFVVCVNYGRRLLGSKETDQLTYWLEFAGIYAFAMFWSVKTYELSLSRAEEPLETRSDRSHQPPPNKYNASA